jgi:hypothetical protein
MAQDQRKEFGFLRTECACRKCQIWCEHMPGYLVPSDITRLIPAEADPIVWAEEHLRASQGYIGLSASGVVSIPSLVPKKGEDGHCHWYVQGRCTVHQNSPFGCAYIDQDMTSREADKRSEAGRAARKQSFDEQSLYAQIWAHLAQKGLIYSSSTVDQKKALAAIGIVMHREKIRERRNGRKIRKNMKKRSRR